MLPLSPYNMSDVPPEDELLSREEFKERVLVRSKGKCAFCSAPATDAHHILDRKLFNDGGYYLNNGVAVCEEHHWQCETTELTLPEVYRAAGIIKPTIPAGFEADPALYDKWGNRFVDPGSLELYRIGGPLRNDAGCRNALKRANLLWTVREPEEISD